MNEGKTSGTWIHAVGPDGIIISSGGRYPDLVKYIREAEDDDTALARIDETVEMSSVAEEKRGEMRQTLLKKLRNS